MPDLKLDLDLAELLLIVPTDDAVSSPPIGEALVLDRFVDGLCRTTGALAGCMVVPGEDAVLVRSHPIGIVGRGDDARTALRTLLGLEWPTSRRGYSWIRHDSLPDHCGLTIQMSMARGTGHVMLLFARDQLDDEAVVAQILTLAPGLGMMASAIHMVATDLAVMERQHHALTAVLRHNECGIVVIGADQGILFANPAARAILDQGDGIEVRRNTLRPTRYQEAVKFQTALDTVIAPPRHMKSARERGLMLLLERSGSQRPLIAVIAPINDDSVMTSVPGLADVLGSRGTAAAIVRLMQPERSVSHGLDAICQLHGLSPVETQLVGCLMKGQTLAETAVQMRIKPDTARTYLKQVFAKTDTHRQTDLLQLVLRYQRAVTGHVLFEAA